MPRAYPDAAVLSIAELLDADKWYYLPWFQRPYSWYRAHAQQLVSDLVEALDIEDGSNGYLLNVISISRQPDQPENAIVDGHQRLMSLTLLAAILRDQIARHLASATAGTPHLQDAVARLSTAISGHLDGRVRYRLRSQSNVEDVLQQFVQTPGGTLIAPPPGGSIEDEAARRIIENRDAMLEMILPRADNASWLARLALFVLDQCRFVVTVFEAEDAAWAAAQRDEQRGLKFHSSDICKAAILSRIPVGEQESAAREWEHWQGILGADNMRQLIGYIRILDGHPASKLPEDIAIIRDAIDANGAAAFVHTKLVPNARHCHALMTGRLSADAAAHDRIPAIVHLGWLDRNEWLLAALPWLAGGKARSREDSIAYFRALERLAYLQRLSGIDPSTQRARYQRIAKAISRGQSPAAIKDLHPASAEVKKLRQLLLASNVGTRRPEFRKLLLRRLNAAVGGEDWDPDVATMTVEHVLPKGVGKANSWHKLMGGKARIDACANMLGNLVPLEMEMNLDIGQAPFEVKRSFLSRSTFALARDAGGYDRWDLQVIEKRTRSLVDTLLAAWDVA